MADVRVSVSDADILLVETFTGRTIKEFAQHRVDIAVASYTVQARDARWNRAKTGETVTK